MTDLDLAKKYVAKAASAGARGLEFSLSFVTYRRLMARKTCAYTGLPFKEKGEQKRTLERIDNKLGYVEGNVIPVIHAANQIKSKWENPLNPITEQMVIKIITKSQKMRDQ